jgi:hypothetical protein
MSAKKQVITRVSNEVLILSERERQIDSSSGDAQHAVLCHRTNFVVGELSDGFFY